MAGHLTSKRKLTSILNRSKQKKNKQKKAELSRLSYYIILLHGSVKYEETDSCASYAFSRNRRFIKQIEQATVRPFMFLEQKHGNCGFVSFPLTRQLKFPKR